MTTENCEEAFGVTSEEIAQFRRISFPFVNRIYPSLIASDIVSVQPLLGPSALVHYLNYRYSKNSKTESEDSSWVIKNKKKKIWRDINEPWEQSIQ